MKLPTIAFLTILLAGTAQADLVNIHLYKDTYAPGETVQAEIFFEKEPAQPLTAKNVKLTANTTSIGITPFLTTLNSTRHFLTFTLPPTSTEGTHTLQLEKLAFVTNGTLTEETNTIDFPVAKEPPHLSIFPGIIVLSAQKNINIDIHNNDQTTTVAVNASQGIHHVYTTQQLINEGATRTLTFTVDTEQLTENPAHITITYEKNYTIPLFHTPQQEREEQQQQEEDQGPPFTFDTTLERLNKTLSATTTLKGPLTIKNTQNTTITIALALQGSMTHIATINTNTLTIPPLETQDVIITVNNDKHAQQGTYEGTLTATGQGHTATFPFTLTVTREGTQQDTEDLLIPQQDTQDTPFPLINTTGQQRKERTTSALPWVVLAIALAIIFTALLKRNVKKTTTFKDYTKNK